MTLGNAWAFPAAPQDDGLGAMKALAGELRAATAACDEAGHPIDLFRALEPEYLRAAADVSAARGLRRAHSQAVHARRRQRVRRGDSRRVRQGVRRELLRDVRPVVHDAAICPPISAQRSRASTSTATFRRAAARRMPVFHSVGASDPLEAADVRDADRRRVAEHAGGVDSARRPDPVQDQAERRQSRCRLRARRAHRSGREPRRRRRAALRTGSTRSISTRAVPTSRTCSSSSAACARRRPTGFERILYIEQPTARDLAEGSRATSCTRRRSCGRSSSTSR